MNCFNPFRNLHWSIAFRGITICPWYQIIPQEYVFYTNRATAIIYIWVVLFLSKLWIFPWHISIKSVLSVHDATRVDQTPSSALLKISEKDVMNRIVIYRIPTYNSCAQLTDDVMNIVGTNNYTFEVPGGSRKRIMCIQVKTFVFFHRYQMLLKHPCAYEIHDNVVTVDVFNNLFCDLGKHRVVF